MQGSFSSCFWLVCAAVLSVAAAKPARPQSSPTAQLPIEPFSPDKEVLEEGGTAPHGRLAAGQSPASPEASFEKGALNEGDNALQLALRVQMSREGFGGQLRLAEFTRPWLSLSQSLRYFDNKDEERLFERSYGFYVGLGLQPWRLARLAPFASLETGWGRFEEEVGLGARENRDLFTAEAAAGLNLRLNRLSSFSLQWIESFFPGNKRALYPEQEKTATRYASVAVFFNMHWESQL